MPLPYHPSGNTTPPSPPPPQGDIVDEDKETADQRATERLLHRAQNLYAEANRLPNPAERGQYLLELGKVGSLLAYRIPEDGPVTQYLGQDRREALADSIDSAILCMYPLLQHVTCNSDFQHFRPNRAACGV